MKQLKFFSKNHLILIGIKISFIFTPFLLPDPAQGISLPFDVSQFADLNALLGEEIATAVVKTAGFSLAHRPFEPATPLGTQIGLDLGLSVTLVKPPSDLAPALNKANPSGGNITLPPFLPVPVFHIHKGLGSDLSYGLSGIGYQGYRVIGLSLKTSLYNPTEGPTYAMRASYTLASFGFASTKTASTEILVSRRVSFGDPYLGIGFQYTYGAITLNIQDLGLSPLPNGNDTVDGKGKAMGYFAIMGVQLRSAAAGVQLTLEGSYSSSGMNTLGTKFGFSF